MTLGECIQRVDAMRPNSAKEAEKAELVLAQERELEAVFFPRYEAGPREEGPRKWPEDKTKALAASGPYEAMYLYAVIARLELLDQEWDAYNIHNAIAGQLESDFKKEWHRTHRLKAAGDVVL